MANFLPLKNYMFFCLQKMLADYPLAEPFLDVGCGAGDVSQYLAEKGWHGKAIDYSPLAVERAQQNLKKYPKIAVEHQTLEEESGQYRTVLMWDALEHIEDDVAALRKIQTLLTPGGYLCIAVPSNPPEWRWDDDFYGHYRRYTLEEAGQKGLQANLKLVQAWDFTFPVFWAMRRIYTRIKYAPLHDADNKDTRTQISSTVNAWDLPMISSLLNATAGLWLPVFWLQFHLFRNLVHRGHEMFVLYQK